MKKRGFTLVELLAVIAILAILVIMALPAVLRMYRSARMKSFENEVKSIYKQAQNQIIADSLNLNAGQTKIYASDVTENTNTLGKLDIQGGDKLKYCILVNNSGIVKKMYVSNGTYQYKNSNEVTLSNIENIEIEDITGEDEVTGKDNCDVVHVSSIEISPKNITLPESNEFTQLTITILPENADNKNVTWSSSNETIAKVDQNGLVTFIKTGNVIITVISEDGNKIDTSMINIGNMHSGGAND